jgi:hypothetical protein
MKSWSTKSSKKTEIVRTGKSAFNDNGVHQRRNSVLLIANELKVEIDYHDTSGGHKVPKWISLWARKLQFGRKRQSRYLGDEVEDHARNSSDEPAELTLAEKVAQAQTDSLDYSNIKVCMNQVTLNSSFSRRTKYYGTLSGLGVSSDVSLPVLLRQLSLQELVALQALRDHNTLMKPQEARKHRGYCLIVMRNS